MYRCSQCTRPIKPGDGGVCNPCWDKMKAYYESDGPFETLVGDGCLPDPDPMARFDVYYLTGDELETEHCAHCGRHIWTERKTGICWKRGNYHYCSGDCAEASLKS